MTNRDEYPEYTPIPLSAELFGDKSAEINQNFPYTQHCLERLPCGHVGYLSIYLSTKGKDQCTDCSNKMRGFY